MSHEASPPPQVLHLPAGAHAVINGALVCAREACTLEVGSGAFVVAGRTVQPGNSALQNPHDELYLSLLECSVDRPRFEAKRERLFGLLAEVIAKDPSHSTQRECTLCAAAMDADDIKSAVESASRMAFSRMEKGPTRTAIARRTIASP